MKRQGRKTSFFKGNDIKGKGRLCLTKKNSPLSLLSFTYQRIAASRTYRFSYPHHEVVLVLLEGECMVKSAAGTWKLGPRKDVFSGRSHSIFMPQGAPFSVSARRCSEIVIAGTCICGKHPKPKRISPKNVCVKTVGKNTFERTVHTIFTKDCVGGDSHLIVGETFNEPGKWSSFPPHKHTRDSLPRETRYEEVYFFKIKPKDRFGFIRVYGKTNDISHTILHNDCAVVTEGYHPVCAAPDTKLYYLWAMAGIKPCVKNMNDPCF